jgi:hypothetical protein
MLSTFDFFGSSPEDTIHDLEAIALNLERYGFISEYVLSTIAHVFQEIYHKEIKIMKKVKFPEESDLMLWNDFYTIDIINYVSDKNKFAINLRNCITLTINSDKFLTSESDYKNAAKIVIKMN